MRGLRAAISPRTGGLYGTFPENEPSGQWWDRSSTYNLINRGKKSLTLDLTTDRGKELFRELVSVSDVVLENYTPAGYARVRIGLRRATQGAPRH